MIRKSNVGNPLLLLEMEEGVSPPVATWICDVPRSKKTIWYAGLMPEDY